MIQNVSKTFILELNTFLELNISDCLKILKCEYLKIKKAITCTCQNTGIEYKSSKYFKTLMHSQVVKDGCLSLPRKKLQFSIVNLLSINIIFRMPQNITCAYTKSYKIFQYTCRMVIRDDFTNCTLQLLMNCFIFFLVQLVIQKSPISLFQSRES